MIYFSDGECPQFYVVWDAAKEDVHTLYGWRVKRLDDDSWQLFMGIRKTTMIGIFIILFGTSLVVYSISQISNIDMENRHLIARGTLIIGFVMMVGGGLITLSPFGRKWCDCDFKLTSETFSKYV